MYIWLDWKKLTELIQFVAYAHTKKWSFWPKESFHALMPSKNSRGWNKKKVKKYMLIMWNNLLKKGKRYQDISWKQIDKAMTKTKKIPI